MTRSPVYSNDSQRRMISLPNGKWEYQEHGQFKGTKTVDPWLKASPSLTRADALNKLSRYDKHKAA